MLICYFLDTSLSGSRLYLVAKVSIFFVTTKFLGVDNEVFQQKAEWGLSERRKGRRGPAIESQGTGADGGERGFS